jgi:8-amino-7-oxononanoate synthase
VIDFTSALYLGLTHPSAALGRWDQLTTGAPAALVELPEAPRVAAACAALIGVERAVLARSTLHAFFDLFVDAAAVVLDEACYPVARWGAERAVAGGARLRTFRHRDPEDLDRTLARLGPRSPLWVAVDGLCTGCGRLAPLDTLAAVALARGAVLVIDDTQALGVLGTAPRAGAP